MIDLAKPPGLPDGPRAAHPAREEGVFSEPPPIDCPGGLGGERRAVPGEGGGAPGIESNVKDRSEEREIGRAHV